MKFDCGLTAYERRSLAHKEGCERAQKLRVWHPWFAWFPVRTAHRDCRWLETIEQRFPDAEHYFWDGCHPGHAEYRPLNG